MSRHNIIVIVITILFIISHFKRQSVIIVTVKYKLSDHMLKTKLNLFVLHSRMNILSFFSSFFFFFCKCIIWQFWLFNWQFNNIKICWIVYCSTRTYYVWITINPVIDQNISVCYSFYDSFWIITELFFTQLVVCV